MRPLGSTTSHRPARLAALTLTLAVLTGCGSSDSSEDASSEPTTAAEPSTDDEAPPEDDGGAVDVVECDTSTFIYEPFTEIPSDWPDSFPQPELLEQIDGEVGSGCDRVTVDMRGRYTGPARDWMAEYGDRLTEAGFELADETDDGRQVLRTYRQGEDVINYGGDVERADSDGEYIGVGIVLTDFPD
jgi:hypothetical protein